MNNQFRQLVIETLLRGDDLPAEWARELFPPEKRETELVYYGKEREEDILADTMAVPLQPERTFGKPNDAWNNMLIFGDNLQAMRTLLEMKKRGELLNADGSVGIKLVYIDPPFATQKEYQGDKGEKAYQDKIIGAQFIEFLRKRLVLIKELLHPNGSVYVHLDWRKCHHMRVVLDELFGENRFMSQIIWQRHDPHNDAVKRYGRIHDIIFWYSNSDKPIYNYQDIVDSLSPQAIKEYNLVEMSDGSIVDYKGQELPVGARRFKLDDCTVKGQNPDRKFRWRGVAPSTKRQWPYDSPEEMDAALENGSLYLRDPKKGALRCRKSYLDTRQEEGQLVQDIWLNLGRMKGGSSYPNEKPEALLDRIIRASSREGDLVLDAFAGSGTTLAVAEKLGRRWIGIDCGKLSIYTVQKRMLNLREGIGNKDGSRLAPKPFTLYNAGLYDFSKLRQLPWNDWRFFALQLFGCRDEPHTIGGMRLDGKLRGASVLVFNHQEHAGERIDEETIQSIHTAVGDKIGSKFFIIAPRNVFDFQQDYIDIGRVRYYAMRIPYSIINELHRKEFTALKQPNDETAVNDTVDSVGFDFVRPPTVEWSVGTATRKGQFITEAYLQIIAFRSSARLRGEELYGGFETLSMVMIDHGYNGDIFKMDAVFYNHTLENSDWRVWFSLEELGENVMAVFIDVHGNEHRIVIPRTQFEPSSPIRNPELELNAGV